MDLLRLNYTQNSAAMVDGGLFDAYDESCAAGHDDCHSVPLSFIKMRPIATVLRC